MTETLKAETSADLHAALVHKLGLAIADGCWMPQTTLRLDELEQQHKVSRSVVREAARVLSSKGMLRTRRRFGTIVQPEESWNLYDPQVIRWRLASSRRIEQVQALYELRQAIEQHAARLAAEQASWGARNDLAAHAARLWAVGQHGHHKEFRELDLEFHNALLKASGNSMFAQLQNLMPDIYTGTTDSGLTRCLPSDSALQLHVDVASAIQRGDTVAAHEAMSTILDELAKYGEC